MTLTLSPQSEARLTAAAQQTGTAPEKLVEELINTNFPAAETPTPRSAKNDAAIALLNQWIAEAPTDPEEIRKADAEREEFLQNLNRNRIESGESPLFP